MSQFTPPHYPIGTVLLFFIGALCSWSNILGEPGPFQDRSPPEKAKSLPANLTATDPAIRYQLNHDAQIKAIAFVPHSNHVLTLDCDGKLRFWDLKSGAEEFKSDPPPDVRPGSFAIQGTHYHSALAVSPDGGFVAVCGLEGSTGHIQVYDVRQKKKVRDIQPLERFGAFAVSFSTRGDRLVVALQTFGVLQWSLGEAKSLTPKKSAALPMNPKNPEWAWAVTHLRGDDVIAVGLISQAIRFYDPQSGTELASLFVPTQPKHRQSRFFQLALSTDGGLLLGVTRIDVLSIQPDDMIHVWDTTTGEKVWTFGHEKFHVGQAAFSPDGRYVAVGFVNNPDVRLYRLSDNKEVAIFRGHTKGVACIAFSPDGTMIASGSLDKTAIVWNVKDGLLATAERPKTEKDYANCWDTLRDGKPLEATEAVASLAAAKDDAVDWLDNKLSPVRKPDAVKVQKWLAQLDDNEPEKREEASRELAALDTLVEDDVKKMLADKPSSAEVKRRLEELLRDMRPLWVRDRDTVRAVRSVYVLERIGSERAVALLKKLADGAPAARLTREAKISLERLEVRAKARQ